jgi:RNase P/RNase MRP subunit p30
MQILNTATIEEARKQIDKIKKQAPEEKIALLSKDDEFNRKALEIKKLDALIINENLEVKDYSKQRNSGLNEVLCEIARKNNIAIGVQLQEIIKKPEIQQARALARLKQNLSLAKRANTKLFIVNPGITDKANISSILLSLEASTKQAQEIRDFSFN